MTATASKRNRIIAASRAEYERQSRTTKGICSESAWVNQALRDAGLKVVGTAMAETSDVIGFDAHGLAADWLRSLGRTVGIEPTTPDAIQQIVERVAMIVNDAGVMFKALKRTGALPELNLEYETD